MAQTSFNTPEFKQVLKEALSETLNEQRELLHEVFVEVLEDVGLSEAIREGLQSDPVARNDVFDALEMDS